MITIAFVAFGGAIGAVARYGAGLGMVALLGHGFPYGTMLVNIAGSLMMGIVIGILAQYDHGLTGLRPFIVTGFLGAFTTFSTFSLDAVSLIERGQYGSAALYIAASVVVSILALMAGLFLTRAILS